MVLIRLGRSMIDLQVLSITQRQQTIVSPQHQPPRPRWRMPMNSPIGIRWTAWCTKVNFLYSNLYDMWPQPIIGITAVDYLCQIRLIVVPDGNLQSAYLNGRATSYAANPSIYQPSSGLAVSHGEAKVGGGPYLTSGFEPYRPRYLPSKPSCHPNRHPLNP